MTPTDNSKRVRSSLPERITSRVRLLDDSKASFLINVQLLEIKSRPSRGFLRRMFERFTEEAMKAIMLSEEETRRLCHVCVATDKILVGLLLAPENNIAAKVLESMGINPKVVSVEAEKIARRPAYVCKDQVEKTSEITAIDIPFNDRALHTLELSYQEARKLGHNYIGSGHLLLGLVSDEGCLASLVLAKLSANASNIRAKVTRMFGENNNETILEITSYQPSVEDVAKIDEELRELEKIKSRIVKEMNEAYDALHFETGSHLYSQMNVVRREISALKAKRANLSMWC